MSVYRRYEDPHKLEKQLAKLKRQYQHTDDPDERAYLAEEIAELKDRVNYAWQDEYQEEDY